MPEEKQKIPKALRILSIYRLFRYCSEVSFKEITDLMAIGKKTIQRDIAVLEAAGLLNIRFSKRLLAYVPTEGEHMACRKPPFFPESKPQRLFMEKLLRLTLMMDKMDCAENPVEWYHSHYPTLSTRTMLRDFAALNAIGYSVRFQGDDPDDEEHPIDRYYCDYPYSTDSLLTFERGF